MRRRGSRRCRNCCVTPGKRLACLLLSLCSVATKRDPFITLAGILMHITGRRASGASTAARRGTSHVIVPMPPGSGHASCAHSWIMNPMAAPTVCYWRRPADTSYSLRVNYACALQWSAFGAVVWAMSLAPALARQALTCHLSACAAASRPARPQAGPTSTGAAWSAQAALHRMQEYSYCAQG